MPKAELLTMFRVLFSAAVAIGIPFLLRYIYKIMDSRWFLRTVYIISVCYLVALLLIVFCFRTEEINGIGVIMDPLWAYKQIFKHMKIGYEAGGILEAVRRIRWVRTSVASLILNILLFIPFGCLLPIVSRWMQAWWKVFLVAIGFSLLIETTQLFAHLGWFDVADPIYNCLGAVIGFSLYKKLFDAS